MDTKANPTETDQTDQGSPGVEGDGAGTASPDSVEGESLKPAEISIITARYPKRLSKRYDLNADGTLKKTPGGNLQRGDIDIRRVETLPDLAAILTTLSPAQALTFGTPKNRARLLITKREHETYSSPHLATPRTKNNFGWGTGAGVMMLDYDPDPGTEPLARDALVSALRAAVPALADLEMLWFPSASSCLYAGEREVRGVRGQRVYIMVASARDIPRAGKVLAQRLWMAGFGSIALNARGSMLQRTLVDTLVWSPERLDFAGGSECGPGLEQRRGEPVLIPGAEKVLDTELALPDVSKKEKRAYESEVALAKYVADGEATTLRDDWVEARVLEMVPPSKQNDEVAMEAARAQAMLAAHGGVLSGDFRIHVVLRGKTEAVTVSHLLEHRSKYEHARCLDPIEPEYNGRAVTGILYLQQARPTIFSFAHGPHTYHLGRARRTLELESGNTSGGVDATLSVLRESQDHYDFGDEFAIVAQGKHASLDKASLAYELGSIFQYWAFNADGEGRKVDPPRDLVAQLLSIGHRGRGLRPLKGVITAPTIRLDGGVLVNPGYDKETELYLDPNGEVMPEITPRPSLHEAHAALGVLFDPFATFPFVSPEAAGAHLAALITAVIRPTLPTAPGFAYDAPVQGSGKTLLAQCVGALAEGAPAALYPHVSGNDDAEIRKRLFAALRSSPRALIWDNVLRASRQRVNGRLSYEREPHGPDSRREHKCNRPQQGAPDTDREQHLLCRRHAAPGIGLPHRPRNRSPI